MVFGQTAFSQVSSPDVRLSDAFLKVFGDVCVLLVEGRLKLDDGSAVPAELHLIVIDKPPAFLSEAYGTTPIWFRPSKTQNSIYVGQKGAKPICRLILANTLQAATVEAKFEAALLAGGFAVLQRKGGQPDQGFNDKMWAKPTNGGVVIALLQGVRAPIHDGVGDQAMVALSRVSKEEFEAAKAH